VFDRLPGGRTGQHLIPEIGEGELQLQRGETLGKGVEHEGRALAALAQIGELAPEERPLVDGGTGATGHQHGARIVDADIRSGVDDAGPELDARQVSLSDGAQAENDPGLSEAELALVRVEHDRGVEQRRPLDGILVGEIGADQQAALLRQFDLVQPVGDEVEMSFEYCLELAVAAGEGDQRRLQRRRHFLVGQGQDPADHPSRPGVPVGEHLLPGDEEPGQHPARVGTELG
jgi:hypothetical protein